VDDWFDPGGNGCEWYAEFHPTVFDRCLLYGDIEGMYDLTARFACCICGGGIEMMGLLQPSTAPSSPASSTHHSSAPPSNKSMLNCDDNPLDFHIAAPLDVTCEDMEQEIEFDLTDGTIILFCNVYGYLMDAHDVMARDACCVCGGGTVRTNVVVPSVSTAPPSSSSTGMNASGDGNSSDPTVDDHGGTPSSSDDYDGAAGDVMSSSSSSSFIDSSLLSWMSLYGFVSASTAVLMLFYLM